MNEKCKAIVRSDNAESWVICPKCGYETGGNVVPEKCDICGIEFSNADRRELGTNADRIRSMSDEELATFLLHDSEEHAYLCCDCCTCAKPGMCTENTVCNLGVIDWLRQPAEE